MPGSWPRLSVYDTALVADLEDLFDLDDDGTGEHRHHILLAVKALHEEVQGLRETERLAEKLVDACIYVDAARSGGDILAECDTLAERAAELNVRLRKNRNGKDENATPPKHVDVSTSSGDGSGPGVARGESSVAPAAPGDAHDAREVVRIECEGNAGDFVVYGSALIRVIRELLRERDELRCDLAVATSVGKPPPYALRATGDAKLEAAVNEVLRELGRARGKFPAFNSAHEGYSVILEELDELFEVIRGKTGSRDMAAMREEAVQVAAMALRFLIDVCGGEARHA